MRDKVTDDKPLAGADQQLLPMGDLLHGIHGRVPDSILH